ncbi:MAG: ferritin-like domain-containing protein, partial [Acidimicrobiales bacterium]
MLLQTAASVENVLVGAYDTILGLPQVTGPTANVAVRNILTAARARHTEHATACNDLATRLGGRPQTAPNPSLAETVTQARPGLGDLVNALDLATTLESTSLQTHQNAVGLFVDVNARRLAAMIMGIEAQHLGVLLVGKGLALARTLDLFSLEAGTAARLPPDSAKAGFPESFSKLDRARP